MWHCTLLLHRMLMRAGNSTEIVEIRDILMVEK